MENALKLLDPARGIQGGTEPVNVQKLESDKDAARNCSFICVDARCHTPVRPSFPEPKKLGRRKSPKPYFSAHRPHIHSALCQGISADDLEAAARQQSPEGQLGSDTRQTIPSRFQEKPPKKRVEASISDGSAGYDDTGQGRKSPAGLTTGPDRRGVSTITTVRTLVHHWRSGWPQSQEADLKIEGCPGRTYGQCIQLMPIADADLVERAEHRFVYHGRIQSIERYGSKGVLVTAGDEHVDGNGDNGTTQRIWIDLNEDVINRAKEALAALQQKQAPTTIYALGIFVRDVKRGGWQMVVSKAANFWVE